MPETKSACHLVSDVTELREEILLHLSLNELLHSLKVCRAWKISTRRIRQALYFEPTSRLLDLDVNVWKLHDLDSHDGHDETSVDGKVEPSAINAVDGDTNAIDAAMESQQSSSMKISSGDEQEEIHETAATEVHATINPLKGPVLNPFINVFLYPDTDGPSLRSLGIITFPPAGEEELDLFEPGVVFFPLYLVWKLAGSVESFRSEDASWRKMQVMQPATTEIWAVCCGFEVEVGDDGTPGAFVFKPNENENDEREVIQVETFGQPYGVTNPTGVTLGEWVDMYQKHHSICPYCVYLAYDTYDDDYGYFGDVPLDRWLFFASSVTRKLEPNIEDGRESFVLNQARNSDKDQLVVPGSGFTGHYVLASIEETLQLPRPAEPAILVEDDGEKRRKRRNRRGSNRNKKNTCLND